MRYICRSWLEDDIIIRSSNPVYGVSLEPLELTGVATLSYVTHTRKASGIYQPMTYADQALLDEEGAWHWECECENVDGNDERSDDDDSDEKIVVKADGSCWTRREPTEEALFAAVEEYKRKHDLGMDEMWDESDEEDLRRDLGKEMAVMVELSGASSDEGRLLAERVLGLRWWDVYASIASFYAGMALGGLTGYGLLKGGLRAQALFVYTRGVQSAIERAWRYQWPGIGMYAGIAWFSYLFSETHYW